METKELQAFTSRKFGTIRTVIRDGEPWFVAADVCRALDVQNITQAVHRLDSDERAMFNIGRQGKANAVNEFGLYNLTLQSRKPEARAFKRWVTHEVLPAIRRTGGYSARQSDAADELLTVIRQERERLDALERELRRVRPAPAPHPGETRKRLCEAADTFVAAVLEMTRSGELRVEPLDAPEGDGDPDGYEDDRYLYLRPSTAYGRYARKCEEYGTPRPDTRRSLYRGLRERGTIEPDNHGGTATRNKLVHGRTRRLLWIRKSNERA
jgi:prophage antirepressor-like protein